MRLFQLVLLWVLPVSAVFAESPAPVPASSPDPRQIMDRVNAVDMGDNVSQDVEMILIDANGRERHQLAHAFRKRLGSGLARETRSIMFFYSPESINGMGFFTWDVDDPSREDRQWLYLPRMKQTKRIAGNDKRLAFMGSDFSHADMALRNVYNYRYRLLEDTVLNGHKVWVIEAVPINDAVISEEGYVRSIITVRQDNYVVVRALNFLKEGNRQKTLEVLKLEQIDGIWVQTEISMETRKADTLLSKTIIRTGNVKFGQKRPDEFFTVRSLEQGLK